MFMGPKFADISRPLVVLTTKGAVFEWKPEHTKAIRKLKEKLINYTTFNISDSAKLYQLHTDASGYAIGAVLEQESRPVAFLSQVMTPTQGNYNIYD